MWRDGEAASVRRWDLRTDVEEDGLAPRRIDMTITAKSGATETLRGEVERVAPLVLPEAGGMRVLECLTRWTRGGETGSGIAEYAHLLDTDGRPAVPVE